MTINGFISSLNQPQPPAGISKLLQSLWYDAKDNWSAAHDIAQEIESLDGSWVHAYLHRKEGDEGNAIYWYRRAGRKIPKIPLAEEWKQIAEELLKA